MPESVKALLHQSAFPQSDHGFVKLLDCKNLTILYYFTESRYHAIFTVTGTPAALTKFLATDIIILFTYL